MIFRFLNLDKLAPKLIFFAVIVLALTLAIIIFYPTPNMANKTVDRFSSSFGSKQEKIDFLKDYINLPTNIEDCEYHIIYYSPSGLTIGAAEWDFNMILKLNDEDLASWLTEAKEREEGFDLSWAKSILPNSWQLNSKPKYYIFKTGEMTVFEEEAVILWKLANAD